MSNKKPTKKTLWQRFVAAKLDHHNTSPKEILAFLSADEARLLNAISAPENSAREAASDEVVEFFFNFLATFGDDEGIIQTIAKSLPAVFHIGATVLELGSHWDAVSGAMASNVVLLTDYIFGIPEDRHLIVVSHAGPEAYLFPKEMSDRDTLSARSLSMHCILHAMLSDAGSIIFRHDGEDSKRSTIEGFITGLGMIEGLPADSAREMNEEIVDDTVLNALPDRYRTPPLIFRKE